MPNITGTIGNRWNDAYKERTGAFYDTGATNRPCTADNNGSVYTVVGFDASRSSAIYGKSTTVQPPALKVRYYIKF